MSRQSGAVESCHTQWSVSVIILYKQVRKVNSTLWQCHTTKSYIICKPSEQWTVPQWSLYFCCKKMHLICDAGGGGRGKLLIVQESKVNWKFTFQSNLKKKGEKKKGRKRDTMVARLNRTTRGTQVRPKWRHTHSRALKKLLGMDGWAGALHIMGFTEQQNETVRTDTTSTVTTSLWTIKHRNVEMFCGQPWQRTILIICNAHKLLCSHFCVQQLSIRIFCEFFIFDPFTHFSIIFPLI